MKTRIAILSLAVVASLGYSAGAFAQGPAAGGGAAGEAATIPSATESRSSGSASTTTGSSNLRSVDRDTAVTPSGARVDTSIAPGGAVGAKAPDANAAAPAGR